MRRSAGSAGPMRDERRSTGRHRLHQRHEQLPRVRASHGDVRHVRSSDARPTGRAPDSFPARLDAR